MVFQRIEGQVPSASEKPDRKAEKADKHVKKRQDLGVEEGMVDLPEIERDSQDAADKIVGARKEIDKKRDTYVEAVRKMYYDGVKAKAGDVLMAELTEKVALAYKDLVDSYQDVIRIQEQAKDPDFVRKLAGDLLKIEVPLIQTGVYKTSYKTEVVKQTFEISGNSQEYQILKNGAEMAVISARADLFLLTGDKKYEGSYQVDVQQRNKNLEKNTATAVERAKKADAKGLSGVRKIIFLQDNEEKYKQIEEYLGVIARKQLEIEKLRTSDPMKAYDLASELYKSLDNLKKDMAGFPVGKQDAGLPTDVLNPMDAKFFQDLRKSSPKVFQRFSQLVDISHNKAAALARDIFQKDPEILQFQRDLAGFMKSGEGLFKTFDSLMKDLQEGKTPSKPYIAKIHEDIDRYINSPYFQNIRKIWPIEKYHKYLDRDLCLIPGARKLIENLSKAYDGLNEYIANIYKIAEELKDIGGDNVGLLGYLKDAGKFALIISACVATGQGLLMIGAGTFASISTISMVSTLGGASLDYLDGNKKAFDPGALIEGYAQGVVMSAASGALARPVGLLWGNAAKRLNDSLAKSQFSWLRKFAERGYLNNAFKGRGDEKFLRKLMSEIGEESFEEGLESVGRAIAPHDAWVGFMFSLLGTSAKTAKDVFRKGKFKIGSRISGNVTDIGIKLEYANIEEVTKFLKERGLDAESIGKLEKDGSLVIEKEGMRLEVESEISKIVADTKFEGLKPDGLPDFSSEGVMKTLGKSVLDIDRRLEFARVFYETGGITVFNALMPEIASGKISPEALASIINLFKVGKSSDFKNSDAFAAKIVAVSGLSLKRAKNLIPLVMGGFGGNKNAWYKFFTKKSKNAADKVAGAASEDAGSRSGQSRILETLFNDEQRAALDAIYQLEVGKMNAKKLVTVSSLDAEHIRKLGPFLGEMSDEQIVAVSLLPLGVVSVLGYEIRRLTPAEIIKASGALDHFSFSFYGFHHSTTDDYKIDVSGLEAELKELIRFVGPVNIVRMNEAQMEEVVKIPVSEFKVLSRHEFLGESMSNLILLDPEHIRLLFAGNCLRHFQWELKHSVNVMGFNKMTVEQVEEAAHLPKWVFHNVKLEHLSLFSVEQMKILGLMPSRILEAYSAVVLSRCSVDQLRALAETEYPTMFGLPGSPFRVSPKKLRSLGWPKKKS